MIYFLAVEDARGQNIAAIYTREVSWTYPRTETASLSLGPARPPRLVRGALYAATLVVVDYEGWVGHVAGGRLRRNAPVEDHSGRPRL